MSKPRTTLVILRIRWDPDTTDHPSGWDWGYLLEGDPFSRGELDHSDDVNFVSFVDENNDGEPEQT